MKTDDVARNVTICRETEKAWLVKFKGGQTGWIPKSMFKVINTKIHNFTGQKVYTIVFKKWLEKSIYTKYNEYKRSQAERIC